MTTLCTNVGIKARKADKVAENFMWNLSLLKTEIDILQATRADTICALEQVSSLSLSLSQRIGIQDFIINSPFWYFSLISYFGSFRFSD